MRIYKCIFAGSECLCDNDRPLAEEDGMFVIKGKYIEIGNEDYGLSENVDEDAAEGAEAAAAESKVVKVVDVVHTNRLTETSFTKASYMAYIKGYMKGLMEKLKEKDADAAKAFAANAQTFVKKVVSSFDEWQFFYPNMDDDDADYDTAIVVLCKWETEQIPVFYYFKEGLKGEKV